jgi:hypothetical protein
MMERGVDDSKTIATRKWKKCVTYYFLDREKMLHFKRQKVMRTFRIPGKYLHLFDLNHSKNTYMKLLRTCLASSVARELAKPTTAKYSYY